MFLTRLVGSAVVASLLLVSGPAQTATINVPGDAETIQAAIDIAVDGDEVVIADGTYTGPDNRDLDFEGKAITVRSAAGDPSVCVIDCEQAGRGLLFDDGETALAVVSGLTIVNGLPADPIGGGGGVSCFSSSPTIVGCVFRDNEGLLGGAIENWEGASPLIADCVFVSNVALEGGAIWNAVGCSPTIVRCVFLENRGQDGGAILSIDDCDVVTIGCDFRRNEASEGGGAIATFIARSTSINCSFVHNSALRGAAFTAGFDSSVVVTNCLLAGNSSKESGGVTSMVFDSSVVMTNCTLVGNSSEEAGVARFEQGSELRLDNCIVWDNGPAPLFVALESPPPVISFSDIEGGWEGPGEANIDADPRFVDAGGDDYRLNSGSPCIDAGSNDALPTDTLDIDGDGDTGEALPLDGDGQPRRVDDPDTPDSGRGDPPIVDIGAYEWQIESCPWDLTGDGVVDFDDLIRLIHALGRCGDPEECPSDFNGDGFVGLVDLIILILHWGSCP